MELVDNYDMSDKVVVLTGGAGVLCSEMARALVEAGAKVAVLDIDENSLEELGSELEEVGADYLTLKTNVLDKGSLRNAAERIKDTWGKIDVLINGAGGNSPKATAGEDQSFFDLPDEGVQQVFNLSQNCSTDIRVNAIAPGFLLTEQNRYLLIDEETGNLTDRGQTIIDHTPMGEFGDPEDLLTTVFWLFEDGSEFVPGTVIPIDGGFSAFSGV